MTYEERVDMGLEITRPCWIMTFENREAFELSDWATDYTWGEMKKDGGVLITATVDQLMDWGYWGKPGYKFEAVTL